MQYGRLGTTGTEISRLCLGCMTFGDPDRGDHSWTLPEDESKPLLRKAVEAGINFFDTANVYSDGTSEEIIGRALKELTRRDEIVVATKVFNRMRPGPNGAGLSRKAIMTEIDHSLRRLGMDYVDLYQIHRWDPNVEAEEIMEALHDVVKAGKARYIGASSMQAWRFAKAQHIADSNGWTRFVTMQNHLNLLYREEEREMLPLCQDQGVGLIPWSPMARGRLTRDWNEETERTRSDRVMHRLYDATVEADRKVIERVAEVAAERGVSRAQVALAWVIQKPGVSAPIIGASKLSHYDDAIAALSLNLSPEEIARLEEPYVPHAAMPLA
ncbi:MAG: aldo/keto reductase [Chelatococcus sp.]|jgi:aryl-alcohol dehydrogenase-like predicted oxidoreductase|uniref:aldo/keto reductase n=1 Tax=Chelatococcus sp. TaxID=1953771 RepID=UPI0025BB6C4E|nr:aldo/keto reductase [Chelatococcus sp.]MBX3539715.1 aldo/keto reductase [Chelatococcus sp.]